MIEILMTLLLLTVVLLGLTALQVASIRQTTATRRTTEATRLAQSILERHQRLPIANVKALTPVDVWYTMLQKDQKTTMVSVGVDGESDGPFSVERMVETQTAASGLVHYLITVRVSWLSNIRGNQAAAADQYQTRSILMSCRRVL